MKSSQARTVKVRHRLFMGRLCASWESGKPSAQVGPRSCNAADGEDLWLLGPLDHGLGAQLGAVVDIQLGQSDNTCFTPVLTRAGPRRGVPGGDLGTRRRRQRATFPRNGRSPLPGIPTRGTDADFTGSFLVGPGLAHDDKLPVHYDLRPAGPLHSNDFTPGCDLVRDA